MDNNKLEKEKEVLLAQYDADQITFYQELLNEIKMSTFSETVQYIITKETGTNG